MTQLKYLFEQISSEKYEVFERYINMPPSVIGGKMRQVDKDGPSDEIEESSSHIWWENGIAKSPRRTPYTFVIKADNVNHVLILQVTAKSVFLFGFESGTNIVDKVLNVPQWERRQWELTDDKH